MNYGGVEWPDYQKTYGDDAGAYIVTVIKQASKKELKRLKELQAHGPVGHLGSR
jgi:hypothetical protein